MSPTSWTGPGKHPSPPTPLRRDRGRGCVCTSKMVLGHRRLPSSARCQGFQKPYPPHSAGLSEKKTEQHHEGLQRATSGQGPRLPAAPRARSQAGRAAGQGPWRHTAQHFRRLPPRPQNSPPRGRLRAGGRAGMGRGGVGPAPPRPLLPPYKGGGCAGGSGVRSDGERFPRPDAAGRGPGVARCCAGRQDRHAPGRTGGHY